MASEIQAQLNESPHLHERVTNTEVSIARLYLLRGMYLLIGVGLCIRQWPLIIAPAEASAGPPSIIHGLLGGLAVFMLLGLRYPLRMLPILLFELAWKVIWVLAFALPIWLGAGLDEYASAALFACMVGIVLIPFTVPWSYVWKRYVRAAGDPWR